MDAASKRRAPRIGVLAPPWPIPAAAYGGVEAMVDGLGRGLTEQGAKVFLWSAAESTCPVMRGAIYSQSDLDASYVTPHEVRHVIEGYRWLDRHHVDVIHDHTLIGPVIAPGVSRTPVVATPHLPLEDREQHVAFEQAGRTCAVVAISRAQAAAAPDINIYDVVSHAVDLDAFKPASPSARPDDEPFMFFLGRMSPEKGVDTAIRACLEAGARLQIAARMEEPAEYAYFARAVEPLLDDRIVYLGELNHADKIAKLQRACALINPINWNEPFGLVMIEALACGCPVLAFERGAAGEIVIDGRTGRLCRSEPELAAHIRQRLGERDGIARDACRRDAEMRFGLSRMARDYLAIYARVIVQN